MSLNWLSFPTLNSAGMAGSYRGWRILYHKESIRLCLYYSHCSDHCLLWHGRQEAKLLIGVLSVDSFSERMVHEMTCSVNHFRCYCLSLIWTWFEVFSFQLMTYIYFYILHYNRLCKMNWALLWLNISVWGNGDAAISWVSSYCKGHLGKSWKPEQKIY